MPSYSLHFAKSQQEAGKDRFAAAVEASTPRLRPILMTSFTFILAALPLVVAEGAGAEMRRSLGTAVFSGMLGVTLFGLFVNAGILCRNSQRDRKEEKREGRNRRGTAPAISLQALTIVPTADLAATMKGGFYEFFACTITSG